jgi:hypothetical protein
MNGHSFMRLQDARPKPEAWQRFNNEARPHTALDRQTPHESAPKNWFKPGLQSQLGPDLPTYERQGIRVKVSQGSTKWACALWLACRLLTVHLALPPKWRSNPKDLPPVFTRLIQPNSPQACLRDFISRLNHSA